MVKKIILMLLLFLVLLPSIAALSLTGKKLSPVTYIPGSKIVNHYVVSDTNYPVEISISSEPFSHIYTTSVINNEFDLILDFPAEEFIPPGSYTIGLKAAEMPSGSMGAISSKVAVSNVIYVEVLSYDKDVNVFLSAPNINEGSNETITLNVNSMGYPNIDEVYSKLSIYDYQNKLIEEKVTEKKALPGLGSITFASTFDTGGLAANNYEARAIVFYDGRMEAANVSFLIGNMDVSVQNYSQSLTQGFDTIWITVKNNWGNRIRNVYAKLYVQEEELVHTSSIDLEPWQEGRIESLMQVPLSPGAYNASLRLFFEGEQKIIPITLQVAAPENNAAVEASAEGDSLYFLTTIVALVLLIVVLSLMIFKKKSKTKNEI